MFPTCEQIQHAAYDRWSRRGRIHGHDRDDWLAAERELTFLLNYRTIAEFVLDPDPSGPVVLGDGPTRRCRFCERTSRQAEFQVPHPALPGGVGQGSLRTFGICDECQADGRVPLDDDFRDFWAALRADASSRQGLAESGKRNLYSAAVLKSMAASALLLLPERELGDFPDALEWVSNPDHDADLSLFAEATCRIYFGGRPEGRSWVSLASRVDGADETCFPYLLYFLGCDGITIQVHVPLCLRDDDLDGRRLSVLERAFAVGDGESFRTSHSRLLPLTRAKRQSAALSTFEPSR